jgi:hypothetical protein
LSVELLEALHVVDHAGMLVRADRAPIERIENQNDVFALIVRQFHFLLALILQREIRCLGANRNCHESSKDKPAMLKNYRCSRPIDNKRTDRSEQTASSESEAGLERG